MMGSLEYLLQKRAKQVAELRGKAREYLPIEWYL